MPHPTILVLSQILTSTLSTDPSVAELLRRQATFLEDDTLPADLKERGAANFHHALFTETPNAIRAGDKVVEVLRRTIIAVGSLYLGMERGMQDEGTRIEGTSMHTAHKQTWGVDDKNGVADLSVQPKRKRTQKDSDGDPESDSTSLHVRDAESKTIRKVIAIRPGRQVIVPKGPSVRNASRYTSTVSAAGAAGTAKPASVHKNPNASTTKSPSIVHLAPSAAPPAYHARRTTAQYTSIYGTRGPSASHRPRTLPKPHAKRGALELPKFTPTFILARLKASISSPAPTKPKSLMVVLSVPNLGDVVKALNVKDVDVGKKRKRGKMNKNEGLGRDLVGDYDAEE
jgi:hypothetical protein